MKRAQQDMNMVTQQGRKEKRRMHSKSKPHTSGVASQIHRKAHKQIYMYHTLLSSSFFFSRSFVVRRDHFRFESVGSLSRYAFRHA